MDIGIVAKRYAKALYAYAQENGSEERVHREMQTLLRHFLALPQLRQALDNPVLTKEEKTAILCQAAGGEVSEAFQRFTRLIMDKRREKQIQFIAVSYADLYRQHHNILTAHLTTASPISEQNLEKMKQLVVNSAQGTVEFETHVDKTIVGGFVLDVNFERMDASVAQQIREVSRQFDEKNKRM